MVKQSVAGIAVPKTANSAELRLFVEKVYGAVGCNYLAAADELGVTAATIWKLCNDKQTDSQVIREKWHILKCRPRPRVWIPTNNIDRAIEVLKKHYPDIDIIYG
jgi:hypothetical protein